MKNILHELYNGRIPGWDSQAHSNIDNDAFYEKVSSENRYFSTIMSKKDFERFKKLHKLHKENHAIRYRNVYTKAFRLGVMLMFAVFTGEKLIKP